MTRLARTDISPIISQLYGGIICQRSWDASLDAISSALGAIGFHHFTLDRSTHHVIRSTDSFGMWPKSVREYEMHYAANDERMFAMLNLAEGGIMADHEHFDRRAMSRSAIYADFLARFGLRHTLGLQIRKSHAESEIVGLLRTSDHRSFGVDDQSFCLRLMPHLRRASMLRSEMTKLATQAAIGASALDHLPQAVLAVDQRHRIHYANRAAEALRSSTRLFRAAPDHLYFRSSSKQAEFKELIGNACNPDCARAASSMHVEEGSGPVTITVLPLNTRHRLAMLSDATLALLIVNASSVAPALAPELLSEFLDLTATESRLASLLAAGKTVKDFAAIQGCTWHTARTHMKNLLRKSGCQRQIDLIRLMHSLQLG